VARLVQASPRVVIGGAPASADAAHLELTGLSGPVEINAENLSATFLAGTPIAEIDAALAPHGLWWPVDAGPDRLLGAVLATGGPYPGRTGYGYVRDWVLGLEVVLAGGERMQLGGQTMKNVAGYDLTRLFVGSRGTLGVIAGATLRLRPRPERMVTLRLPRESMWPGCWRAMCPRCWRAWRRGMPGRPGTPGHPGGTCPGPRRTGPPWAPPSSASGAPTRPRHTQHWQKKSGKRSLPAGASTPAYSEGGLRSDI
jgi:hypothetical protein